MPVKVERVCTQRTIAARGPTGAGGRGPPARARAASAKRAVRGVGPPRVGHGRSSPISSTRYIVYMGSIVQLYNFTVRGLPHAPP